MQRHHSGSVKFIRKVKMFTNQVLAQVSSSNGGGAGSFLLLAAVIAFGFYWTNLQNAGVRPRSFTTNASVDAITDAFDQKVGGRGWKIVEGGNPRVAQSSLATGVRQQIGLFYTRADDGSLAVAIAPIRVAKRGLIFRRPTKAHTLRFRLNGFESALRSLDPQTNKGDLAAAKAAFVAIQNSNAAD
jgi:hypothetical protein